MVLAWVIMWLDWKGVNSYDAQDHSYATMYKCWYFSKDKGFLSETWYELSVGMGAVLNKAHTQLNIILT